MARVGKVPVELLERFVYGRTGAHDERVIVGPAYGEDAAIVQLDEKRVLVVHCDPITEAVARVGWLAVHVACNDVAVRGAKPQWLLTTILLPEGAEDAVLDRVTSDIHTAAREIGVTVIGGHTEWTPRLDRVIVVMTAIGIAERERVIRTSGARAGDLLLMTKGAGLEGTAILAHDLRERLLEKGVSAEVVQRASLFLREISIVPEALALAAVGATAMHDPTEGGLLGGVVEMAYAAQKRIDVFVDRVLIRSETRSICDALRIDPLRLIGSGCLLATLPPKRLPAAQAELQKLGVEFAVIGEVREGEGAWLHYADGRVERLPLFIEDEIGKAWAT